MNNKENWVEFFDSFIELCEVSCKEIENHGYFAEYSINIKIALIFNVKHSIELFLKSVIRMIDSNEVIKSHNLEEVFINLKSKLEEKLKNFTFQDCQAELREYIEQEKKEWEKGSYFSDIKEIIKYYDESLFLEDGKKAKDIKNTFFRYPEDASRNTHDIDYYSFIYGDKFDVYKISEDISVLSLCFNSIKTILV